MSAALCYRATQLATVSMLPTIATRRSVATVTGAHSVVPRSAAILQVLAALLWQLYRDVQLCKSLLLHVCSNWRPTLQSCADTCVLRHSFMMEYDIHTVLDLLTLVATLWVIYELRFPLADTYQKDQDTIQSYHVVRIWPMRPSRSACLTTTVWACTCGGCASRGTASCASLGGGW